MIGPAPKVSFIPKAPVAQGDFTIRRSRPTSLLDLLVTLIFILSVGGYAGLYFYDKTLQDTIATKDKQISGVQELFSQSAEVSQATVFRSRVEVVKDLLSKHIIISPVFSFLAENTSQNVLYNSFDLTTSAHGTTLTVAGEAPTYTSLAYQVDTFKKNTNLTSFALNSISLTTSGSIGFTFEMTFKPNFLSYVSTQTASAPAQTETTQAAQSASATTPPPTPAPVATTTIEAATGTTAVVGTSTVDAVTSSSTDNTTVFPSDMVSLGEPVVKPPVATSSPTFLDTLKVWFEKFKFW